MNKNYLKYLFKNYRVAILFFAVLFLGISATPFITRDDRILSYCAAAEIMSVLSIGMTFILPVILFAFVHRRRSADLFFALPISRKDQLITNLLFAFFTAFGIFCVTSLILWIPAAQVIPFKEVLLLNALAALSIACLLLIHTAWYLIANNIFDGIVMIAAWSVLPLLVFVMISEFGSTMVAGQNIDKTADLAMWLSPLAMSGYNLFASTSQGSGELNMLYNILIALWGVIGAAGSYFHFVRRKSERAEQLSDDPLAYPLIINFYALGILIMMACSFVREGGYELLSLYLLLLFIYVVAQFVFNRKIRITPKILITFAILSAISGVFAVAAYRTHGFGLAERYTVDDKSHIRISYSSAVYKDDFEREYNYEYNDSDFVNISVELLMPVKDYQQNTRLYEMFESYRQDGIDFFYSSQKSAYRNCRICFMNCTGNSYDYSNRYDYTLSKPIAMDDLQYLIEIPFARVEIYDSYSGEEYTLSQWLARKGN